MKIIISLSILMLLSLHSRPVTAQGWTSTSIGIDSTLPSNYFNNIERVANNDYVLFGRSRKSLTRIDLNSNVLWNQYNSLYGSGIEGTITLDGGYIMVDDVILKMDSIGAVVWALSCDSISDMYQMTTVATTDDGGYIMAGKGEQHMPGPIPLNSFFIGVMKVSASGNVVWKRQYGQQPSSDIRAYDIKQTSDGGYILAGGDCPCDTGEAPYILKMDASGNEQWSVLYEDIGTVSTSIYGGTGAMAIVEVADGYVFTGGAYLSEEEKGVMLIKLNNSGVEQWRRFHFFGEELGSNTIGYDIISTNDGGFAVCGATGGDFFLMKTSNLGFDEWVQIYDFDEPLANARAFALIHTPEDNGYLLAGYKDEGGPFLPRIIKTDSLGYCTPKAAYTLSQVGNTISVSNTAVYADSIRWQFGNGVSDTLQSLSYTYPNDGSYQLCQIAYNGCGNDTLCQQIEVLTSINEPTASSQPQLEVYPNPASQQLFVSLPASLQSISEPAGQLRLYNSQGQCVYSEAVNGNGSANTPSRIPIAHLAVGVYWLQWQSHTGQQQLSQKVVVSR